MGHAYEQGPIHKEADQGAMIRRTMDILTKFTGKKPVGWLGPGLTQTLDTPSCWRPRASNITGDWVYDDEPTTIRTANGPLVTLPYTIECNDIPMMLIQHHESDYLLKRTIDQFDRLYAESKKRAKFVALAIHPTSAASRTASNIRGDLQIRQQHKGLLHWNGAQILDWYQPFAKN